MSKMMIGTDEVLKVMFGTDEVSSLAMGEETIPITPPTPPAPDYSTMPFTIEALGSGNIVLSQNGTAISRSFYISINGGAETSYTIDGTNTSLTFNVSSGDTISFRATQQQNGVADTTYKRVHFKESTANYVAYGNISSLSYPDFESRDTIPGSQAYYGLFYFSSKLVSAENLIFPTVANQMFCFSYMFCNCTSLTTGPVLPADAVGRSAYANMFQNCSSLTHIESYATYFDTNACNNWVQGVSATGTFVKKTGATWASGDSGIPTGWAVVDA